MFAVELAGGWPMGTHAGAIGALPLAADVGVVGSGRGWSDFAVAAVRGMPALSAAHAVVGQARKALKP